MQNANVQSDMIKACYKNLLNTDKPNIQPLFYPYEYNGFRSITSIDDMLGD